MNKKYIIELTDSGDGSGDGILQLPPDFCLEEDWREGDDIHLSVGVGTILVKNLSREYRENLLKQAPPSLD